MLSYIILTESEKGAVRIIMNNAIYSIAEIADRIIPVLEKYGVTSAYIFGSYARGEATQNSDIDLFIDASNIKGLFMLSALYEELKEALEKDIDLVTMNSLKYNTDDDFVQNVRKDSVLLYECA